MIERQPRIAVCLALDTTGEELKRADDPRLVVVPGYYVLPWPVETLAGPFEDQDAANDWANEAGNGAHP